VQPTQKPVTGVELTPADILRLAAIYLRRHGWTQGDYYALPTDQAEAESLNPTPPACALGAIGMAIYGTPVADPFHLGSVDEAVFRYTSEVLRDHLELNVFGPPERWQDTVSVSSWNDDYAYTADEVIAALEAAAKEWEHYHPATDASDTVADDMPGGAE
jgi:hypothetical protein